MCEGGINTGQMKLAVAMVNDSLALAQQWLEQLHHLADQGRRTITSAELAQVTVMLGEAREKLDIPPVFDKETGLALPGTGIRTGVTKISWADGRFAVKVMSATLTVAELLPIAEAVKLDVE
jgi:hypothetical protein